jgi:hypothetical protein
MIKVYRRFGLYIGSNFLLRVLRIGLFWRPFGIDIWCYRVSRKRSEFHTYFRWTRIKGMRPWR